MKYGKILGSIRGFRNCSNFQLGHFYTKIIKKCPYKSQLVATKTSSKGITIFSAINASLVQLNRVLQNMGPNMEHLLIKN